MFCVCGEAVLLAMLMETLRLSAYWTCASSWSQTKLWPFHTIVDGIHCCGQLEFRQHGHIVVVNREQQGPKMLSWGTPVVVALSIEIVLSTFMQKVLLQRNIVIRVVQFPQFVQKPGCQTQIQGSFVIHKDSNSLFPWVTGFGNCLHAMHRPYESQISPP